MSVFLQGVEGLEFKEGPLVTATSQNSMHVAPGYQPIFREVGLDAEGVFTHPDIKPWRTLNDRENCTLDVVRGDGSKIRFHIKRFPASASGGPADLEVNGLRVLQLEDIPTAPLVGIGPWSFGSGLGRPKSQIHALPSSGPPFMAVP